MVWLVFMGQVFHRLMSEKLIPTILGKGLLTKKDVQLESCELVLFGAK